MQMGVLGFPHEVCALPEEALLALYSLHSGRCLCRLAAHKGSVLCCQASDRDMLSGGQSPFG